MTDDMDFLLEKIEIEKSREKNKIKKISIACDADVMYSDEKIHKVVKSLKVTASKLNISANDLDIAYPSNRNEYLYKILSTLTKAQIAVREEILGDRDNGFFDRVSKIAELSCVKAIPVEHGIVRIILPPLVERKYTGSYDIYRTTKLVLGMYRDSHEIMDLIGKKLLLIYKRYVLHFERKIESDNDNWECKRITNAISEVLEYSDNLEHLSILYSSAYGKKRYVEATLIEEKNLPFFVDYLTQEMP